MLLVGVTFPLNPETLHDFWKIGKNVGAGISYPMNDQLGLQVLANYSTHKIDQEALLGIFGLGGSNVMLTGGDANILTVTAGFKVYPQPPTSGLAVYGIAGIGFIKLSTKNLSGPSGPVAGPQTLDTTALGPGVGMGFDLMLGERFSIFVESQYFMGLNEGESTQHVPVRFGLTFQ
jgi:opacity protein-like surface antigen